ncbi:MAG TPA: hypothetical protein VFL83_22630 [Anaeromyxobacter sp.]|nr:hypothetical protein [Anaeromyxobacter sp.]
MGCGAYAHVTGAVMRAWKADGAVTPRMIAALLATDALPPLAPEGCGHEGTRDHGGARGHGQGRRRHLH